MKISRTTKVAVLGGAAVIGLLPIAAGQAMASDHGTSSLTSVSEPSSKIVLSPSQVSAIVAARGSYRAAVTKARVALESALSTIRTNLDSSVSQQREAVLTARDAYWLALQFGGDATAARSAMDTAVAAYRAALTTAQATAVTSVNAARTTASTALDAAKTAYVTAVTAQFPAGTTVPRRLLMMPRVTLHVQDEITGIMRFSKESLSGLALGSGDHGWSAGMGNASDD